MAILVKNIKQLVQAEPKAVKFRAGKEMQHLPIIENAYLLTEGDKIKDFGPMAELTADKLNKVKENIEEHVYKTIIPRNIRLAEAPSYGLPITLYEPKSAGAEAYLNTNVYVCFRPVIQYIDNKKSVDIFK